MGLLVGDGVIMIYYKSWDYNISEMMEISMLVIVGADQLWGLNG